MPIETVIRPILDTVLDAVVVMDRDGLIRAWNHHAETMFGWTADEAIGRDLGELIVPPALREAHHRGLARFNVEGVGRVLDTRLELAGLRRDGGEIPVELSITLVSREGRDVFVGFLRDLSERRQAERQMEFRLRESQLMLDLSERASRDESFEEVLVATLDSICDLAEWPLGHAFVVAEDDFRLVSTGWSTNAANVAPDLVEATEKEQFTAGVGLPGDVLASRQPIWMAQVAPDSNFPRRDMGFESGFAFPVFSADRCIAVLEFFSRDPREPDPALLMTARAIGAQIGRVHERKRGADLRALLLAELDHRAKNILSVVRGIAHLSFGTSTNLEDAQRTFDRRIDSIAKANDILHAQSGKNALLGEIVREALGHLRRFVDGDHVLACGARAVHECAQIWCAQQRRGHHHARLDAARRGHAAVRFQLDRIGWSTGDSAGESRLRNAHPEARHGAGDGRPCGSLLCRRGLCLPLAQRSPHRHRHRPRGGVRLTAREKLAYPAAQ